MQLEYSQYVQMHDNMSNTRSTMARTNDGIALLPVNSHKSWFLLSLSTGKRVIRSRWTPCTISNDVIQRVKELSEDSFSLLSALEFGTEGAMSPINASETEEVAEIHTNMDNNRNHTNAFPPVEENDNNDDNVNDFAPVDIEGGVQGEANDEDNDNLVTDNEDNSSNEEEHEIENNATPIYNNNSEEFGTTIEGAIHNEDKNPNSETNKATVD